MINTTTNEFQIGSISRVLVELTKSKDKNNRFYSAKQKIDRGRGSKFYRCATLQGFLMTDCTYYVKQTGSKSRDWVRENQRKDVHAWVEGKIIALIDDTPSSESMVYEHRKEGGYNVSYDPYKSHSFLLFNDEHYPSEFDNLNQPQDGKTLFFYPRSILFDVDSALTKGL